MRMRARVAVGAALATALASVVACVAGEPRSPGAPVVRVADSLSWSPAASLPPGARRVVLEGEPRQAGLFTVRLSLPAGFQVPPHYHGSAERLTVLSGSIRLGYGDALDTAASRRLPAGAYAVNPAWLHHYSWTSEPAVVQITGEGPWLVHYVRPRDDPRVGGPP